MKQTIGVILAIIIVIANVNAQSELELSARLSMRCLRANDMLIRPRSIIDNGSGLMVIDHSAAAIFALSPDMTEIKKLNIETSMKAPIIMRNNIRYGETLIVDQNYIYVLNNSMGQVLCIANYLSARSCERLTNGTYIISSPATERFGSLTAYSDQGEILWNTSDIPDTTRSTGIASLYGTSHLCVLNGQIWQIYESYNKVRLFDYNGTLIADMTINSDVMNDIEEYNSNRKTPMPFIWAARQYDNNIWLIVNRRMVSTGGINSPLSIIVFDHNVNVIQEYIVKEDMTYVDILIREQDDIILLYLVSLSPPDVCILLRIVSGVLRAKNVICERSQNGEFRIQSVEQTASWSTMGIVTRLGFDSKYS